MYNRRVGIWVAPAFQRNANDKPGWNLRNFLRALEDAGSWKNIKSMPVFRTKHHLLRLCTRKKPNPLRTNSNWSTDNRKIWLSIYFLLTLYSNHLQNRNSNRIRGQKNDFWQVFHLPRVNKILLIHKSRWTIVVYGVSACILVFLRHSLHSINCLPTLARKSKSRLWILSKLAFILYITEKINGKIILPFVVTFVFYICDKSHTLVMTFSESWFTYKSIGFKYGFTLVSNTFFFSKRNAIGRAWNLAISCNDIFHEF